MKKSNNNIGLVFAFLGLLYFFYIIITNSSFLFKKFDPIQAEKKYSESQWAQSQNVSEIKILDEWALKNGYTGWRNYIDEIVDKLKIKNQKSKIIKEIQDKGVSDSFLYSYVGYKYSTGVNPSLLNPEHPPLAKYLIGYSIQLFGNEHMIGIGLAFISLLLVAVISFQIHGSILFAGLSLFIFSLFPLFVDQIIHGPQLELYQLFFFLLVVHMLLMGREKNKFVYYIFVGVFFGMLLSTKTLLPFLVLFSGWLVISLWKKWKELFVILIIGAITFCLTYWTYFVQGGTLRSFLGMQKYIVTYYGNSSIPIFEFAGNYLRLIFTGSWKFWDASRTVSAYSEWSLLWPIIFIIGIYKLKINWLKYKRSHLFIWFFILYNLFIFIIPIFPRYLLLLFTPLIILL
jgi:hypothetical protein